MINLNQIKTYYPAYLHSFERFIIREYLQHVVLELIFDSKYASKLSFLGGTCLRIVSNNSRFSEDLDFDNFNLSQSEFDEITNAIQLGLTKLGYEAEIRNVTKGAYHCYIRFPELLYNEGLTGHKEEKILISLDSEPHNFKYTPNTPIINKFDIFTRIFTTPEDIILSMKFYALLNRKRNKGRDFFDIIFLLGKGIKPNYNYLQNKIGINSAEELKNMVIDKCSSISMKEMADDVKQFLFYQKDEKKVLLFIDYLEQTKL